MAGTSQEIVLLCGEDSETKFSAASTYVGRLENELRSTGREVRRIGLLSRPGLTKKLGLPPSGTRMIVAQDGIRGPVFLYSQKLAHLLWAARLSRRFGVPLVLWVVEYPTGKWRSPFQRVEGFLWIFAAKRKADKFVVFSEEMVQILKRRNSNLSVLVSVPLMASDLLDAEIYEGPSDSKSPNQLTATYCADIDGYLKDALFVVKALASLTQSITLFLVGRSSTSTRELIKYSAGETLNVEFLSDVDDEIYFRMLTFSDCLLVPYSDSLRNAHRFPSKLMDYLLVGSNVVIGKSKLGARLAGRFSWVRMADSEGELSFGRAVQESCVYAGPDERRRRVDEVEEHFGRKVVINALLEFVEG